MLILPQCLRAGDRGNPQISVAVICMKLGLHPVSPILAERMCASVQRGILIHRSEPSPDGMAGVRVAFDLDALAGQIRDSVGMLAGQWQLALDHDGRGAKQDLSITSREEGLERSVEIGRADNERSSSMVPCAGRISRNLNDLYPSFPGPTEHVGGSQYRADPTGYRVP